MKIICFITLEAERKKPNRQKAESCSEGAQHILIAALDNRLQSRNPHWFSLNLKQFSNFECFEGILKICVACNCEIVSGLAFLFVSPLCRRALWSRPSGQPWSISTSRSWSKAHQTLTWRARLYINSGLPCLQRWFVTVCWRWGTEQPSAKPA